MNAIKINERGTIFHRDSSEFIYSNPVFNLIQFFKPALVFIHPYSIPFFYFCVKNDSVVRVPGAAATQTHTVSSRETATQPQTESRKRNLCVMSCALWLSFLVLPWTVNLIALNK